MLLKMEILNPTPNYETTILRPQPGHMYLRTSPIFSIKVWGPPIYAEKKKKTKQNFKQENSRLIASTFTGHYKKPLFHLSGHTIKS